VARWKPLETKVPSTAATAWLDESAAFAWRRHQCVCLCRPARALEREGFCSLLTLGTSYGLSKGRGKRTLLTNRKSGSYRQRFIEVLVLCCSIYIRKVFWEPPGRLHPRLKPLLLSTRSFPNSYRFHRQR
jgi:hypothetical protein